MLLNLTVYDAAKTSRGSARMRLDFGQKLWFLEEDNQQAWQYVGFSNKGSFEVKDWGVSWIWDQDNNGKRRNTVIVWDSPRSEDDSKRLVGRARLFEPKDPNFKECQLGWAVDTTVKPAKTPEMARIRKRILEIIKEIPFHPQIDKLLVPGQLPMINIDPNTRAGVPGQTNCGNLPGYVAKKLDPAPNVTGKIKGVFQKKDPTSPTGFTWTAMSFETKITKNISSGMEQFASDPRIKAWVPFTKGDKHRPEPGDFYVLDKDTKVTADMGFSHVGIFIEIEKETGAWITADAGQGPAGLKHDKGMAAGYRRRYLRDDGKITGEPTQSKDLRILKGWLNIDSPILFPTWATPKK